MSTFQKAAMICLLISGVISLMVSIFFAEGAIAENYTDKTFVEPRFFVILVIWGFGVILFIIQLFKDHIFLFIISVFLMFGSTPIGYFIAMYWSLKATGQI